ncbi:DUF1835 domain-containing protein [Pontibacter mangrovi]|uniref:DUF1835 domain-containing protein n=1 Tax=Pontibacter mangrovi TaxID=2589816 RepID=A0A501WD75_9BACT|nr:DUF1835 domain-containing protein [Pontibacter mangrovi]TPE46330.1 DUF1835 domain-containing protein [Pontibacter mangrovi]
MKILPTLHILNGDASLPAFTAAKLPGQVLVWREVLSEGPVSSLLPQYEFWQRRQAFITAAYGESAEGYREKVLDELQKLEGLDAFFEVVLWFDADLMCQVNQLYVLQRLQKKKPKMVSICTPPPGKNIALMSPDGLFALMEQRQQVPEEELRQAASLWQAYASPDPMALELLMQDFDVALPHLLRALRLHLRRFPDCADGLSQPERALLQLIQEGCTSVSGLIKEFNQQDPGYGFGDAQLQHILARLQPDLVQAKEPLVLSFFGERVLDGIASFTPKKRWVGGVEINGSCPFCYDKTQNRLRKDC